MGHKLTALEEGTPITLLLSTADSSMQMGASIKKHVKDNISLITLEYDNSKKLIFDNVQIDVECPQDDDVPIIWHNVKIVNYKSEYVVQTPVDGVRHNRRNFFRVGVSIPVRIRTSDMRAQQVMIRDLSLSGFSITDRSKEINLNVGDSLSLHLEDVGFNLDLAGRVVRIEQRELSTIYGLEICNMCKDLSAYINVKQRRKNK